GLANGHDAVDRLAAGEELRLGQDGWAAPAGLAAFTSPLLLRLESGRPLDRGHLVVDLAGASDLDDGVGRIVSPGLVGVGLAAAATTATASTATALALTFGVAVTVAVTICGAGIVDVVVGLGRLVRAETRLVVRARRVIGRNIAGAVGLAATAAATTAATTATRTVGVSVTGVVGVVDVAGVVVVRGIGVSELVGPVARPDGGVMLVLRPTGRDGRRRGEQRCGIESRRLEQDGRGHGTVGLAGRGRGGGIDALGPRRRLV